MIHLKLHLADATQVGANIVITADADDSVTLEGVSLASLTSSNFEFVSGGLSGGTVLVTLSGIPTGVSLSDSSGALTLSNGSVTLRPGVRSEWKQSRIAAGDGQPAGHYRSTARWRRADHHDLERQHA